MNIVITSLSNFFKVLSPNQQKQLILIIPVMIFVGAMEILCFGLVFSYINYMSNPAVEFEKIFKFMPFLENISYENISYILGFILICTFIIRSIVSHYTLKSINMLVLQTASNNTDQLINGYFGSPYEEKLYEDKYDNIQKIPNLWHVYLNSFIPALSILSSTILMIMLLAGIIYIQPVLSILLITILGTLNLCLTVIAKKLNVQWIYNRNIAQKNAHKTIHEIVRNYTDIKLLGAQKYYLNQYKVPEKSYINSYIKSRTFQSLPFYINDITICAAIVISIVFLYRYNYDTELIIPILAFFALAGLRFIGLINITLENYNTIFESYDDQCKLIKQLKPLQETVRTNNENNPRHDTHTNNLLQFENVSYRNPTDKSLILKNLNLTIEHGDYIAIEGKSGSGKSTLTYLMSGLIKPTTGTIYSESVSLKNIENKWHQKIGFYSSRSQLTNRSIMENIAFGITEDEINENKVWQALEFAEADTFVKNLENGLHTHIHEEGLNLSDGQKQRLLLARVLYKNPQIIILDEATSALDEKTELKIIKKLEAQKKDALIITSHRKSILKRANKKIILKNGEIQ